MPKIAIIGCGGMGRHHANVLTRKLERPIAAASDEFEAARRRFRDDYPDTEVFANHKELLEKVKPDAVWICLPTFLHTAVALDCARSGAHILIEKPITIGIAARVRGVAGIQTVCKLAAVRHSVAVAVGLPSRPNREPNRGGSALIEGGYNC